MQFQTWQKLTLLGLLALIVMGLWRWFWPAGNQEFVSAEVVEILETEWLDRDGQLYGIQMVRLDLGNQTEAVVQVGSVVQPLLPTQILPVGQRVIVTPVMLQTGESWQVVGIDRRLGMWWLFAVAVVVIVAVARWQGISAVIGLMGTLAVVIWGVIPLLQAGWSPLIVAVLAAAVIAPLTTYLTHGWKRLSHVSILAQLVMVIGATALSWLVISVWQLTGLGVESAAALQFGPLLIVNTQGLLLAGMLLGLLGILDDVIISQLSIVRELQRANPSLSAQQLYTQALQVGRDHMASVINTLVLAYVGVNLPLLVLLNLNQGVPGWVILSGDQLSEEVARSVIGSMALILTVPVATMLGVWSEKRVLSQL